MPPLRKLDKKAAPKNEPLPKGVRRVRGGFEGRKSYGGVSYTSGVKATAEEANLWYLQVKKDISEGRFVPPERGKCARSGVPTVAEWLKYWFDTVIDGKVKKNGTRQHYDDMFQPIIAALGTRRLDQLTTKAVNDLWKSLSGNSKDYVARIRSTFSKAIEHAMVMGEFKGTNPVALSSLPRCKATRPRRYYTPEEMNITLRAAVEAESRFVLLYRLGFTRGLRPGELTAVRWSRVDWENGKLTIDQMTHRVYLDGRKGSYWLALGPIKKSEAGASRTITIKSLVPLLKAHKAAQAEEQLAAARWADEIPVVDAEDNPLQPVKNDLIFPTTIGTLVDGNNLTSAGSLPRMLSAPTNGSSRDEPT